MNKTDARGQPANKIIVFGYQPIIKIAQGPAETDRIAHPSCGQQFKIMQDRTIDLGIQFPIINGKNIAAIDFRKRP